MRSDNTNTTNKETTLIFRLFVLPESMWFDALMDNSTFLNVYFWSTKWMQIVIFAM